MDKYGKIHILVNIDDDESCRLRQLQVSVMMVRDFFLYQPRCTVNHDLRDYIAGIGFQVFIFL